MIAIRNSIIRKIFQRTVLRVAGIVAAWLVDGMTGVSLLLGCCVVEAFLFGVSRNWTEYRIRNL
ncbi:hypothetical protein D3C71_1713060 [compost metagenome]